MHGGNGDGSNRGGIVDLTFWMTVCAGALAVPLLTSLPDDDRRAMVFINDECCVGSEIVIIVKDRHGNRMRIPVVQLCRKRR